MHTLLGVLLSTFFAMAGEPEGTGLTMERLKEQLKTIAPIVEKHAERKFKELPTIRIVDGLEMVDLLIKDMDFVRALLKVEEDETLDQVIDSVSDSLSLVFRAAPSFAGKYVLHKKEIVVSVEAIDAIAEQRKWPPATKEEFVKLVLSHELVHALTDEVVGYERAISNVVDSKQKQHLFPMINEGIACVLTHRMKKNLGIDRNFDELEQVYTLNPMLGEHYVTGRQTMEKVLDRFGTDGLWATLANPFSYDPGDGSSDSVNRYREALLSDPVKRIMKCGVAEFMEVPPEMGMQFFKMMDPKVVTELKAGLERVCTAGCMKKPTPAAAIASSVTVYIAKDEDAAKAVHSAISEATDKMINAVGVLTPFEPSTVQQSTLSSGVKFQWRRADSKLEKYPMKLYVAWMLLPNHVVVINTINATPPHDDVTAILDTIESKLANSN